jgi:uncharacterized protein YcaQ
MRGRREVPSGMRRYIAITNRQARRFLLAHHGLGSGYDFKGKSGVLDYIQRVGSIQFDPLNIVGNNPELVLQARVMDFEPEMLQELLYEDRELLDGWDKNMSIYSVGDWPCFQRYRDHAQHRFGGDDRPATQIMPQVRAAIEQRGPLSSIDLDFDRNVDWSWAPTRIARAALESMYSWGELVVHHRVHTRKVYDFASRHLASNLLDAVDPNQSDEAYHDWHVYRRVGAVGLLWNRPGDAWLGMLGIKSPQRQAAFTRLLAAGKLIEIQVENIDTPLYLRHEDQKLLESSYAGSSRRRAAIMAPLDNLLWDRRLINTLFGFDYVWEVYKPVAERRYGYYVLPVLYGDRFVARFEPGRDKDSGALVIKNWWWETGISSSKTMRLELTRCFKRFLRFLGTDRLQIDKRIIDREELHWLRDVGKTSSRE